MAVGQGEVVEGFHFSPGHFVFQFFKGKKEIRD